MSIINLESQVPNWSQKHVHIHVINIDAGSPIVSWAPICCLKAATPKLHFRRSQRGHQCSRSGIYRAKRDGFAGLAAYKVTENIVS